MRIKDMRDATSSFNVRYRCYWENENELFPISDLQYNKMYDTLFLIPQYSNPIRFQELNILLNTLGDRTKLLIKTKSGKNFPLFGFRIVNPSKILFS